MKHILVFIIFTFTLSFILYDRYEEERKFRSVYAVSKQELLDEYWMEKKDPKKLKSLILKTHANTKRERKVYPKLDSFDLRVDFYPQSPYAKWGPIFNDTCEEASLLLALNYIREKKMTRLCSDKDSSLQANIYVSYF